MIRKIKDTPPRLDLVFQRFDAPVYFVTFNTHKRAQLLANPGMHAAFADYCEKASAFHIGVGRYVIMPDHIHLFVSFGAASSTTLGAWIKGLKRRLDIELVRRGDTALTQPGQRLASFWQPGFFDHLLRSEESYGAKWDYVRRNPVRAGYVAHAEEWPYAGEIVRIDRP